MKKAKLMLIIYILLSTLYSCNIQSETKNNDGERNPKVQEIGELEGTIWSYKIAENCFNTYRFKPEGHYTYFSCEMEDTSYGTYYVKNDTLYLYEYVSASDSLLAADSPHRSEKSKYKVIMVDNKLKHLFRYAEDDGIWQKTDYKFSEDYLYERQNP